MRVDKKLNVVIPLPRDGEGTLYVHATPISREAFETYFLPISVAFSRIWSEGLSVMSGPRVALKMLKKVSEERKIWEGPEGVQAGFVTQQKQAFRVGIQSSDRIHPRRESEFRQRPVRRTVRRELAKDTVGFVEGD